MSKLFKPEKKKTREENLNFAFSMVYFFVVLGILALIAIAIWGAVISGKTADGFDPNATFAVILAGITITLASSIIIPKVLLKNEVETAVITLKNDLKDEFREKELKKFLTDNLVLDGHMSRMISLLLLETSGKENKSEHLYSVVWSLGWAIRSYKKYISASQGETMTGEDVSLDQYRDLVMVIHENSSRSSHMFFDAIEGLENVTQFVPLVLNKDLGPGILKRNSALFYRTIKETLDIEYEINFEWKKKNRKLDISSKAESQIKDWLSITAPVVAVLIGVLLDKLGRDLGSPEKAREKLVSEVTRRSNFKNDDDYAKNLENCLDYIVGNVNMSKWSIPSIKHVDRLFRYNNNRSAS